MLFISLMIVLFIGSLIVIVCIKIIIDFNLYYRLFISETSSVPGFILVTYQFINYFIDLLVSRDHYIVKLVWCKCLWHSLLLKTHRDRKYTSLQDHFLSNKINPGSKWRCNWEFCQKVDELSALLFLCYIA